MNRPVKADAVAAALESIGMEFVRAALETAKLRPSSLRATNIPAAVAVMDRGGMVHVVTFPDNTQRQAVVDKLCKHVGGVGFVVVSDWFVTVQCDHCDGASHCDHCRAATLGKSDAITACVQTRWGYKTYRAVGYDYRDDQFVLRPEFNVDLSTGDLLHALDGYSGIFSTERVH